MGITAPHQKNKLVTKYDKWPWTWMDSLGKEPKLRKMDMREYEKSI
jgi:hypothetical protein